VAGDRREADVVEELFHYLFVIVLIADTGT